MDATVRVWKASAENEQRCQRVLPHHSLGVKSAKWSIDGRQILSGGFDGLACCTDVETGQMQQTLRRPDPALPSSKAERITTVHFHPTEPNSMLLGTDQGHIYCHDLRGKSPHHAITTYSKSFSDVHDLLFLGDDGQRFVSSAGVMQRDASNQTLLVWDWSSATLLYDRLDSNMLAHSCLRAHPTRPYFVAQCSGNYATLYSSRAPYKSLKGPSVGGHRPPLRFAGGHEVEGSRIQCSFSRDGALWASGDANGRVAIYRTSGERKLTESFQLYGLRTACTCAEFQSSCTQSGYSQRALLMGSSAGDVDLFRGE
jgi:WD40 repeat protein